MSDIKLFRRNGAAVTELEGAAAPLERALQTLFEQNLEALLGVRFLASEYKTTHGGRMDTLGIDENGCPVIIEYKRDRNENVINQGLFYLDWLMDHRGDFAMLVRDRFDKGAADGIEWSAPRLICVAGDFTKYDEHAVKQMSRNIELIRYRRFGDDLLLLDQLTSVSVDAEPGGTITGGSGKGKTTKGVTYKTVSEALAECAADLQNLYADVESALLGLGDDITKKTLRFYFAFRRIKNFACVEVRPTLGTVRAYLKLNPDEIGVEYEDITRDMRGTGHFGTGDLEVTIRHHDDLNRAKPLFLQSYEAS